VNPTGTDRPDTLRSLLRRNLPVMAAAFAATAVVQLGLWAWAAAAMSSPASTAMALFAAALWTAMAAPVLGASGARGLDGLLRAGAVIDASMVLLIVLAAKDDAVGWWGAVKVYLVLVAAGVALCGVTRIGRTPRRRCVTAAVAAIVLIAISAAPLWTGGMITAAGRPWSWRIARAVVAANPFFAISGTMAQAGFIWQERPVMYEYAVLGRDVLMPSVMWWVTALLYAAGAAVAWVIPSLFARGRPGRT